MTAVEFLKIKQRMCVNAETCSKCPLSYRNNADGSDCDDYTYAHLSEALGVYEAWAKEHPTETRLDAYMKLFPNANVNILAGNFPHGCVLEYDLNETCIGKPTCTVCKRKFWTTQIDNAEK